jgi:CheY-like chemotaxis protein
MTLRVLIAEDEALVAMSLHDLLEADGHEVELAFDGVAALVAARRLGTALDVLVTDLNMPYLGGEALILNLRAERPDLPVVVVTGSPPPGGATELRKGSGGRGPLVLLHKPVDYQALLAALREVAHTAPQMAAE